MPDGRFAVPEILYTDNGSDFTSRHLEQVWHLVLKKIVRGSQPRFANDKSVMIILVLQKEIVKETGFRTHRIQKRVQQRQERAFFARPDLEVNGKTEFRPIIFNRIQRGLKSQRTMTPSGPPLATGATDGCVNC